LEIKKLTSNIGIGALLFFTLNVVIFGIINGNFNFLSDNISNLGAKGVPYALWFNIFAFAVVGVLLMYFGFLYGKLLNDILVSVLLALFGLAFAFFAVPVDLMETTSTFSKIHTAAVCFGLAFWLFALARIASKKRVRLYIKVRANITSVLIIFPIITAIFKIWSIAITVRLVFGIVFAWILLSSLDLRYKKRKKLWK
jgi:hypothetical protein